RVLAWVTAENGTEVSAELARRGLGVPFLFEPNDRYYATVVDAASEARAGTRGLFDPAIGCSPEGQARKAQTLIAAVAAAKVTSRGKLDRQLGKLDKAWVLAQGLRAERFGLTGSYAYTYLGERQAELRTKVRKTRAVKKRQLRKHQRTVRPKPTPAPVR